MVRWLFFCFWPHCIPLWFYPDKVSLLRLLQSHLLHPLEGSLEEGIMTLHLPSLTEPSYLLPCLSWSILSILTLTGVLKSLLWDGGQPLASCCLCLIINAIFLQYNCFPRSFQVVCACCDRQLSQDRIPPSINASDKVHVCRRMLPWTGSQQMSDAMLSDPLCCGVLSSLSISDWMPRMPGGTPILCEGNSANLYSIKMNMISSEWKLIWIEILIFFSFILKYHLHSNFESTDLKACTPMFLNFGTTDIWT